MPDFTELLAPGGSMEGIKASVNAGADAIYMGGQMFGARAFADNPDQDGVLEALDYCHTRGKKVFMTVNTLLREQELSKQLYDYMLPYYEHGLDAVLVQDLGVFNFMKREFPDLALHCSTQMSLASVQGAKLLKEMGAERVVPAREIGLKEIKAIHDNVDIEIECFVHGALCYCYSGQCLMSSMIGGRSGNRGRCAQPCRMAATFSQDGVEYPGTGRYKLSLKDISTLRLLPQMLEAGVNSLKMEGRMKRPEYAAGITSIYRKYLDMAIAGEKYKVDPADEKILMDLYNRGGFSEGYYETYHSPKMMTMQRPNHVGTQAVKVLETGKGNVKLKALEDLFVGDHLEASRAKEKSAEELVLKENIKQGGVFSMKAKSRFTNGQVLPRVRNEKLLADLRAAYVDKISTVPIIGYFEASLDQPCTLTLLRGDATVTVEGVSAQLAGNRPTDEAAVRKQLEKTGGTPFCFEDLHISLGENLFLPVSALNELRRDGLEALQKEVLSVFLREKPVPANVTAMQSEMESRMDAANAFHINDAMNASHSGMQFDMKSDAKPEFTASVMTSAQARALKDLPQIKRIYLDSNALMDEGSAGKLGELTGELKAAGKEVYVMMPPMWRERMQKAFWESYKESDLQKVDGFVIRAFEQYEDLRDYSQKLMADASIYSWNKEACAFLKEEGFDRLTVPLELNRRQIESRGFENESEMVIYGRYPLMITAQCLVMNTDKCQHKPHFSVLTDRKDASFPVWNSCSICTNIIYNSVPLDLTPEREAIRSHGFKSLRLSFTDERPQQTKSVANAVTFAMEGGELPNIQGTRGHYKRGVE